MMVLCGKNRFVDCGVILAFQGEPLLTVAMDPLHVCLASPDVPNVRRIRVDRDTVSPSDQVRVVATEDSYSVFWDEEPLVIATRLAPDLVHLHVDLRPIGMQVYDDVQGLHVGTNLVAANVFEKFATGINIAS